MSREQTRIVPNNTGWIEGDLGTYLFWKDKAGKKILMPATCFWTEPVPMDPGSA